MLDCECSANPREKTSTIRASLRRGVEWCFALAMRKESVPKLRIYEKNGHKYAEARIPAQGIWKHEHLGRYEAGETEKRFAQIVELWRLSGKNWPPETAPVRSRSKIKLKRGITLGDLSVAFFADVYEQGNYNRGTIDLARMAIAALKPWIRVRADQWGMAGFHEYRTAIRQAKRRTDRKAGHPEIGGKEKDHGYSQRTLNGMMAVIRRMYRWGMQHDCVHPDAAFQIMQVPGFSTTETRPTKQKKAISREWINKVLAVCSDDLHDLIMTHLLVGARPNEILIMRPIDIDTSGGAWLYTPQHHKLSYRGKQRVIAIGPQAQEILNRRMPRSMEALIFPMWPNSTNRTAAYRQAVKRVCRRAGLPEEHWFTPYDLRHTYASELARDTPTTTLAAAMGHHKITTTQQYVHTGLEEIIAAVRNR
ncbi:MAG TPA: hypothetical protein ENJ35_06875 [Gammaproteobacteria bacterium]|nr:hypothetical protein [Gammaproteobacteria bacterium]